MSTPLPGLTTAPDPSSAHDAAHGSGVLAEGERWWGDLTGFTRDRLRLAALETRLAGLSLVTMIAVAVVIALLLSSAWLGLVAVASLRLMAMGVAAEAALVAGVFVNLLLASLLTYVVRAQSRRLQWPATLGSLAADPSPRSVPARAAAGG